MQSHGSQYPQNPGQYSPRNSVHPSINSSIGSASVTSKHVVFMAMYIESPVLSAGQQPHVGPSVGASVIEGSSVGSCDGASDGISVGIEVGDSTGCSDGECRHPSPMTIIIARGLYLNSGGLGGNGKLFSDSIEIPMKSPMRLCIDLGVVRERLSWITTESRLARRSGCRSGTYIGTKSTKLSSLTTEDRIYISNGESRSITLVIKENIFENVCSHTARKGRRIRDSTRQGTRCIQASIGR